LNFFSVKNNKCVLIRTLVGHSMYKFNSGVCWVYLVSHL